MERVAEGVWLLRGGFPRTMNVYLIEDEGGVTVFDTGIKLMANQISKAAAKFGGVKRVVLGHSHADHRGAAAKLAAAGVPIHCHPAELDDAQGDGGSHYFHLDMLEHGHARLMFKRILKIWDGGPVKITETLSEGDTIAGFDVVHLPGHAPGMIALWRDSDRVALTSDAFYTLDPQTARKGPARVPHAAFNMDSDLARASVLKLSALNPASAWPGHADPLLQDTAAILDQVGRGNAAAT